MVLVILCSTFLMESLSQPCKYSTTSKYYQSLPQLLAHITLIYIGPKRKQKYTLLLVFLLTLFVISKFSAANPCRVTWPHWQAYVDHFIQWDGRVIEHSQAQRTTSEGQAYALFYALVANNKDEFNKILNWTQTNLAYGDLTKHLPAWEWGQKRDGSWGVKDKNSASDADLWLAYSLLKAGQLWQNNTYTLLAHAFITRIESDEVVRIPNLGAMVLPGPKGFVLNDHQWKLNLSYLPIQLLRALAAVRPYGPWSNVIRSYFKLLEELSEQQIIADWVVYDLHKGKLTNAQSPNFGSYDAIRIYLWAGMLADRDPLKPEIVRLLGKILRDCHSSHWPPERIDALTGTHIGSGPIGFKAALIPFLKASGSISCLNRQSVLIDDQWRGNLLSESPRYFDQNLALFGLGWVEGRFRFKEDGHLVVPWEMKCQN